MKIYWYFDGRLAVSIGECMASVNTPWFNLPIVHIGTDPVFLRPRCYTLDHPIGHNITHHGYVWLRLNKRATLRSDDPKELMNEN